MSASLYDIPNIGTPEYSAWARDLTPSGFRFLWNRQRAVPIFDEDRQLKSRLDAAIWPSTSFLSIVGYEPTTTQQRYEVLTLLVNREEVFIDGKFLDLSPVFWLLTKAEMKNGRKEWTEDAAPTLRAAFSGGVPYAPAFGEEIQPVKDTAPVPLRDKPVAWIGFKVTDPDGNPIPNVNLDVLPPNTDKAKKATTTVNGTVDVLQLQSGNCSVTSAAKGQPLKNVLNIGGNAGKNTKEEEKQPLGNGPFYLAKVDEYKVKTGDSLQSIAQANGLTFRELAQFNWNTSTPDDINNHLRADVGCSKKTQDGKNYIFDDSDEPGIILVPTAWEMRGGTHKVHNLEVRAVPAMSLRKNWIELEYLYADETPVAGASYEVKNTDGDILAEGVLDKDGLATVDIPQPGSNATVRFFNNPELSDEKIIVQPEPHNIQTSDGWLDRIGDTIATGWEATKDGADVVWEGTKDSAVWTWGVVQGDFNENPTVGQIIVNTGITMIPIVDQVGDVRDIAASLKKLIWDKKYDDWLVWLALTLTAIGLIPVLGSLVKGVGKLLLKAGKSVSVADFLKVFNKFGKGNGIKWLKNLDLDDIGNQAAKNIKTILDSVKGNLKALKEKIPDVAGGLKSRIDDTLDSVNEVYKRVDEMVGKVMEEIGKKRDEFLKKIKKSDFEENATTKTKYSKKQESEPPPKKKPTNKFGIDQEVYEALAKKPVGDKVIEDALKLKKSNPKFKNLSDEEIVSLHAYTGAYYREMNNALRKGDPDAIKNVGPLTQQADSAMAKLQKNSDNVHVGMVYRGTNLDDARVNSLFPDNGIHIDKGFMSSSTTSPFTGNVQIKAISSKGIYVEELSAVAAESEVLFRPNSKFNVLKKIKNANGIWEIVLQEI